MSLVTFQSFKEPHTKSTGRWAFVARPSYDTGRCFSWQDAFFATGKGHLNQITIPTVMNHENGEALVNSIPEIGSVLALDLGSKRVGAAVSDPTMIAVTSLTAIPRSNWKQLLRDVRDLIQRFDAKTLVIGFPLSLDGREGSAATAARQTALNFALSLSVPVYLQDERLTSQEAEARLREEGFRGPAIRDRVDSESAAIILRDFLGSGQQRTLIERPLD